MDFGHDLNLAICGHVKSGKSTLAGRLLHEFGVYSDAELDAIREKLHERLSATKGLEYDRRDLNRFNAPLLAGRSDTFRKGTEDKPLDPTRTEFPTRATVPIPSSGVPGPDSRRVKLVLLDTPGHEDYLKALYYGLYLADCAVLVVEHKKTRRDQIDRILRVLSTFRIPIVATCITKMDLASSSPPSSQTSKR